MLTKIDDLAFEVNGDLITLEQDAGCGEVHTVTLHAIHIRHLAEAMGMVKVVTGSSAELLRDLSRYKRALLMLRDQSEHLYSMMVDYAAASHDDIGVELAKTTALADFASHICTEFEGDFSVDADKPSADAVNAAPMSSKPVAKGKAPKQVALGLEVAQ
jgi:hypothetical protein